MVAPARSSGLGALRMVLLVVIAVAAWLAVMSAGKAASAMADSCNPGTYWYCGWERELAPQTRGYFHAANEVRNWIEVGVGDIYGGTVTAKCAHVEATNTQVFTTACGSGEPVGAVNQSYNPSYAFVTQNSSGTRIITGIATSPIN